ncbi:MAG: peptidylprolyl isomerase [Clostridioides sp.]|jgi:foldase protein PrsA|nr:peptidylprolyl isomerase [Clostridioides sp.]
MKKLLTFLMSLIVVVSMVGCSSSNTVATVGDTEITKDYYEKLLKANKLDVEAQYGKDVWTQEVEKGVTFKDKFKESIIQQLVENQVVYDQAKKDKLTPTDKEIKEAVAAMKKNMESNKEYKKQLTDIGIDEEFLKTQITENLALQKFQEDFSKKTKISDEEIKKYYDTHKDEFKKDEVKASHILLKTVDDNNKPLPKEKIEKAKKKAEEALKKVKAGEDFAKVAKEYSQDSSAQSGGDLGTFGRGQMVAEFEKAAFSMKVGDISDLVKTQYGYHIIKLTDKDNEQTSLEDAKETIKANLMKEKYIQKVDELKKAEKSKINEELIKKINF